MTCFVSGCIFLAAMLSALFFVRFWKETKDRFFLLFAASFIFLGAERVPALFELAIPDKHPYFFLPRLLAFVLILVAIFFKNQRSPQSGQKNS